MLLKPRGSYLHNHTCVLGFSPVHKHQKDEQPPLIVHIFVKNPDINLLLDLRH